MREAKIIQSRLTRKGQSFSLAQIKRHISDKYPENELTEENISKIVDELLPQSKLAVTKTNELSHTQKQTLIQEIASSLDVNLSIDQIKQVSQKMDWALSDRASLRGQIKSAIIAWIDYQLAEDMQQTDDLMQEVEDHFVSKLQESNERFNNKARKFSDRVNESVENFRNTKTEILNLFKIPS
jgi:uncharacterized protein YoxC